MSGFIGNGRRRRVRDEGRIDPQQGYAFMKAHRDEFPLLAMCRALDLSPSGYYDWLKRAPSEDSQRDDGEPRPDPGDSARERWEVRTSGDSHRTAGGGRPGELAAGRPADDGDGVSWGGEWNASLSRNPPREPEPGG